MQAPPPHSGALLVNTLSPDVLVAGAGPAGLAVAVELAERGVQTLVVAPGPWSVWANNFGVWGDTFPFGEVASRRWEVATVRLDERRCHRLDRPYLRVDNLLLQTLLKDRARDAGVHFVEGAVEVADDHGRVRLSDGTERTCRWVVDATGHSARLTRRSPPRAWQVAWGIEARVDGFDAEDGTLGLMDWSPVPGVEGPPTFLYTMPLGGDRVFLEETALACEPPLSMSELQRRLEARLAHRGWTVREVVAVERCRIPLDAGLPERRPTVVAFGGAASMVHPSTGYQLARALRAAPRVAAAIADGADPHSVVWPASACAARALHLYGLDVLLGLDAPTTRDFFDAFFRVGAGGWRTMLDADASPTETAAVMARMLLVAPAAVRRSLFSASALARAAGAHRRPHPGHTPPGSAGLNEEIPWRSQ